MYFCKSLIICIIQDIKKQYLLIYKAFEKIKNFLLCFAKIIINFVRSQRILYS